MHITSLLGFCRSSFDQENNNYCKHSCKPYMNIRLAQYPRRFHAFLFLSLYLRYCKCVCVYVCTWVFFFLFLSFFSRECKLYNHFYLLCLRLALFASSLNANLVVVFCAHFLRQRQHPNKHFRPHTKNSTSSYIYFFFFFFHSR